ncbi:hypothetical protein FP2506_02050 [Fulvimarina pelagi HTCC2506]|uniref:Uncharacterized protein n=1 Tax=Fulvimarina pelagi HTCC2506 TaxID=314231 RepID=Q0FYL0_9HYPH|nr:hypothetical protein FP2506_02050 [Fulvimarina pelagi HTCC2506]
MRHLSLFTKSYLRAIFVFDASRSMKTNFLGSRSNWPSKQASLSDVRTILFALVRGPLSHLNARRSKDR